MNTGLMSVIAASPTIWVLAVLSVLVVTLVLERMIYLRGARVDAERFMERLRDPIAARDHDEAVRRCASSQTPLARVMTVGLQARGMPRENIDELMAGARLSEKMRMEKYLLFLGSMGAIGPLLGLFGTVMGLSRAFHDLALSGSAGPSVVAAGISEALYATVAGLGIAIPTVLAYNYLMGAVRRIAADMEIASRRLLVWLFPGA